MQAEMHQSDADIYIYDEIGFWCYSEAVAPVI